jgi:hypothetical protein
MIRMAKASGIIRNTQRKRGIMGVEEPNEEEKAEMEQAQQQPDPTQQIAAAKTADLAASKLKTPRPVRRRRPIRAQGCAGPRVGGPEEASCSRWIGSGAQAADIDKKTAEAAHIRTQTAHLPEQLAIEGHNAETNRLKALKDRAVQMFKSKRG